MTSHDAGIDTVLLDLDGTLVDSVYQHTAAWRAAFRDVGVDVASHRLHRSIGMGGDRLVAAVAGESVENAVGDEVRARHKERLDERFHEIVATDGAVELLEELRTRGFTLVLASSADKELSERLLEIVEGAAPLLHDRVAGGEADESKPAPCSRSRCRRWTARGPCCSAIPCGTSSRRPGSTCPASGCAPAASAPPSCSRPEPSACTTARATCSSTSTRRCWPAPSSEARRCG